MGRTTRVRHENPNWVWVAYGIDAPQAIQLISPWLGERRRARAAELLGEQYVT
jgi:hypothetical protein